MTITISMDRSERLRRRAVEVSFRRVLVTVIGGFFYWLAWLLGATWVGLVWCALAAVEGFQTGRQRAQTAQGGASSEPGRPG